MDFNLFPINFNLYQGQQETRVDPSFDLAVSALLNMKKRGSESDRIDSRATKISKTDGEENSLVTIRKTSETYRVTAGSSVYHLTIDCKKEEPSQSQDKGEAFKLTTAKPMTDAVDLLLAVATSSSSKVQKAKQNKPLKLITRYLTEDLKYELLIGESQTIELKAYNSKQEKDASENIVTKKGFPSIDRVDGTRKNSKGQRQFCVNLSTHEGKEFWIDQSSAEKMISLQPEEPKYVIKEFLNWRIDKQGALRATVCWNGFPSKKDRDRVVIEKGSDLHTAFISQKGFDPY